MCSTYSRLSSAASSIALLRHIKQDSHPTPASSAIVISSLELCLTPRWIWAVTTSPRVTTPKPAKPPTEPGSFIEEKTPGKTKAIFSTRLPKSAWRVRSFRSRASIKSATCAASPPNRVLPTQKRPKARTSALFRTVTMRALSSTAADALPSPAISSGATAP